MNIITNLLNSFTTEKGGFAARKLTAFALMFCIAYIHLKFVNESNAIEALIIDLIGVAFFLGLVSVTQILELKNGKKDEPNKEL
jgi:hypothetical protein